MTVNKAVRTGLIEMTIRRTCRKEGNRVSRMAEDGEGEVRSLWVDRLGRALAFILGEMGNYWRVLSRGIS